MPEVPPSEPKLALPKLIHDAIDIGSIVKLGETHERNAVMESEGRMKKAGAVMKAHPDGLRDAIQTFQKDIAYDMVWNIDPEELASRRYAIVVLEQLWDRMKVYSTESDKIEKSKAPADGESPEPSLSSVA